MGKSPGKWIKSLLFGKKSFRPRSSKGRDALKSASEDAVSGGNGLPASIRNVSPVIPGSLPVSTSNPELEKETPSRLGCNASPEPFKEGIQQKNEAVATSAADNSEKSREDQAATMVQAAFRGYLARRAFYVLKGIIRLQALIRGHLVRRQAISTIHSMLAIIKFQAVFRGHRVRASGSGVEVCSKFHAMVIKRMDSQEKLYAHKLVRKLLSSSIISLPLKIHYAQSEPNSSYSWMERWTFSGFWKSVSQPRKVIETKPHAKKSTYAMETESIRLKRNVRKSPLSGDGGSLSVTSDLEKPKRSIRKIYSPPLDTTIENQPSELEKVKRNLRKISSSILGADDGENGIEKSSCNPNKLSNEQPDVPNQNIDAPVNEIKQEDELTLVKEKESIVVEGKGSTSNDCNSAEMNQSQSMDRYANPELNDGLDFTEEQISHENHNSRKRTSLSAKLEYSDNSVQNTRTLPSYMAATESAKAKHRAQTSPRFSSESAEKNGIIRRHSLPSTNGKLASFSPRSQRPVQGLAKGIINNRCLLSSRDGNEKLIQVEWRR